jgi:hypothetical protein
MVWDALAYPFRRSNAAVLGVAVFFASLPPALAAVLPALPYIGLIALILECVVLAYLLIFFQGVMEAAARGEADFPMWPEETDLASLAGRVFHLLVPLVVSFLPLIAFVVAWVFRSGTWGMPGWALGTAAGLALVGFCYLPVALLAFSFYGETAVLNVIAVVRSIARLRRDYAVVVVLLMVLAFVHGPLAAAAATLPAIFAWPLAALLFVYFMAVATRAIGLLYFRNKERLGWEI